MFTKQKLELTKEIFGEKFLVVSKSGYGKSYTTRIMIEEGLNNGNTFIIIDPQEAYLNIPQMSYVSANDIKNIHYFAKIVAKSHKNLVISTKGMTIEEQNDFLYDFLNSYRKNLIKGIQTIVIDEAHKFAPEQNNTKAKELVRAMFQENRSDGLGCIAITQRIARLDKTIVSQADNIAIGKLTSHIDKNTIKSYLDNADDVDKIAKLEKGEFYLLGFGLSNPEIHKIRKAKTEHSGNSPKNILNEDAPMFNNLAKNYAKIKKGDTMSDDIVNNIVPSPAKFMDFAVLGGQIALGGALSGIVSNYVGSMFKSPIPVISSRTLVAGGTTLAMYTGYNLVPEDMPGLKNTLKIATATSSVYTLGSAVYDLLDYFKVDLPPIMDLVMTSTTGVAPMRSNKDVDLDTSMN